MTPKLQRPEFKDITVERAYEIASELQNSTRYDGPSTTVFYGDHAEHGTIYVVIPPLGDATLLPIVIHNLNL